MFNLTKTDTRDMPKASGFTLIEMMVAVSIFAIVALIATSTLMLIMDASRRADATRSLVDNLNFALDSMSDKIRGGNNFSGTPGSCDSEFTFQDRLSRDIQYQFINSAGATLIQQCINGLSCRSITSTEIEIQNISFT